MVQRWLGLSDRTMMLLCKAYFVLVVVAMFAEACGGGGNGSRY
jgi:hypothetical protein